MLTTMYRGARLRDYQVSNIKEEGMRYYWNSADDAVDDIFRALQKNHKLKQLGTNGLIRSLILEGCRPRRLQIWGTADKSNAISYARATPELIFLVLDYALVERKKVINYLNHVYGKPYVITFQIDEERECEDINHVCGLTIKPEKILAVEKVDLTQPDPWMQKFKGEENLLQTTVK